MAYIPIADARRGHGFVVLVHARQRLRLTGTKFRFIAALSLRETRFPLLRIAV
jgi:hypothetical protein